MLEFNPITLADKNWINELFYKSGAGSEEFNFVFCRIWKDIFNLSAARFGDFILIQAKRKNYPPSYLFPAGAGDPAAAVEALKEYCAAGDERLIFHTVLKEQKVLLETLFPGRFEFLEVFDYNDYVYDAESLITLAGKKLHAKRNHINRFRENNPDWSYEAITPENLPEVILMNEEWCRLNGCDTSRTLREESCSVRAAIRDYFALDLSGGLIRAGGKVIAFSMGCRLNHDTFLVHIEKAFGDIQGAYAIINQQFAEHNCRGYRWIDREDDSGDEGLRRAKHSYNPAFTVEKYFAKERLS